MPKKYYFNRPLVDITISFSVSKVGLKVAVS